MLLILIPIAIVWLGIAAFVVCLCRMAAIGDVQQERHAPQAATLAEVVDLEQLPLGERAGTPAAARPAARRARAETPLRRRRVVTPR
jgi:hypothetical protein